MAETPETPTPSLAERIDVFLAAPGVSDATSDDLLRAAAAQLRQLDRIKAAYEAIKGEHLATSRPFWADCDNAKCGQLVRHLAYELDAMEVDDGT